MFVPYYFDVPRVVMSQIWGIPMTGKSFSYILGLQVSVDLNNILFTVTLTYYDVYIDTTFLGFDGKR